MRATAGSETIPTPMSNTILIVDDEEINLALLESVLKPEGYTVIRAKNGREALDKIDALKNDGPDIVLTDIMMPVMDGYEVCRQIKQKDIGTPVVLITAISDRNARIEGLKSGADEFLTKPIEPEILLVRVRNLLKLKEHHDWLKNKNTILKEEVDKTTQEIRTCNQQLKDSSMETVYRLLLAAEYRDDDTGKHILRVGKYARLVAERLGINGETLDLFEQSSMMHDLGKIGIPDSILLKPGRLTPEEFDLMKRHAAIGARILSGSGFTLLKFAEEVALNHHEKYNGSGYPAGKSGDAIPLFGRISAIADVFDALTSQRPYKPAFPVEKSIDIIKQERGKHFDPQVVDVFLSSIEEVIKIKESLKE